MIERVRIPRMPREHQFGNMNREEWERVVFEEADHFTCTRYLGRVTQSGSKFETHKHPNILEAVKDALTGGGTRKPMLYAVAKTGRNVMIPRDRWVELINEFAARNPHYEVKE